MDNAASQPDSNAPRLHVFARHDRTWRDNLYVYPVVSRRSGGLSIGVNLNPDMACNFDCIYCQVDRTVAPRAREVDVATLRAELEAMLLLAADGAIFDDPAFSDTPTAFRVLRDIAFSGDGEPTTCRTFTECVRVAADLKERSAPAATRMVLITDACYLSRPPIIEGVDILCAAGGEVWAKLDAGTEAYYQLVNRPNYPLEHVVQEIIFAAKRWPVCIQALWMRVHGEPPPADEVTAFVDQLQRITQAGGSIRQVQIYTVARKPAESFVSALTNAELSQIAQRVAEHTGLRADVFGTGE